MKLKLPNIEDFGPELDELIKIVSSNDSHGAMSMITRIIVERRIMLDLLTEVSKLNEVTPENLISCIGMSSYVVDKINSREDIALWAKPGEA